jgi:thiol-disulfide isomerase/thioredoxin
MNVAVILLLRELARRRVLSRTGTDREVLPIGAVWSGITFPTLTGAAAQLPEPAVDQIIVVGAKRCGLCRQALSILSELAAKTGPPLRYLFVYPGTGDEFRLHLGDVPPGVTIVHDVKNVMRSKLGIAVFPYAVGIDATGKVLAAKVTVGREGLSSLVHTLGYGDNVV